MLAAAWWGGVFELIKAPEQLRTLLERGGIGAMLAYLAALVLLGAAGLPPVVLVIPTGTIWPAPLAFAISLVGGTGAAVLGFLLSRYVAQDYLDPRIPPRVRAFEHRLESHPLRSVIVLRLLFYLFPPVNWLLGLSHIRVSTFVAGTLLGAMPGTLVFTLTGSGLIPWILGLPPVLLAGLAAMAAAGTITAVCFHHRRT